MEETKQTNQNEEFNFGASKEIQDLILKTDNRILLVIIYEAFRKLRYEKRNYLSHYRNLEIFNYNTDEFKVFENYVLGNFEEIKDIKKEIEEKKQSVDEKEIRNLLQQYMKKGDIASLKKANELKRRQEVAICDLNDTIEKIEENYECFSKIISDEIKDFHSKKFIQTEKIIGIGILLITKFGISKIDLKTKEYERDGGCYSCYKISCESFKEWKDITFEDVKSEEFIGHIFQENETDAEARMNQLKENIRLQQAKNVAQTTNPRSAR